MGSGFVVEIIDTKPQAPEPTSATDDIEARKDLLEAISRLDRGQHKAAIKCAADAVNRMAIEHGAHGWASY